MKGGEKGFSSYLAEHLTALMFFVIPLVIEKYITTHTRAKHKEPHTVAKINLYQYTYYLLYTNKI